MKEYRLEDRGFDYIKNMQMYFCPKTPYTALLAALKGLLPTEAFVYRAVSIEPVADTPENLAEIERILGQKEQDLETSLLLMDILGKLIRSEDKEVALFAAESINAIENRYNTAVEKLEEKDFRKKAVLFIEMAELNRVVPDLKNFYLHEAFSAFRELEKAEEATHEDLLMMSRILLELGIPAQAWNVITRNNISGTEAAFVLAEIAFREKNFSKLFSIIAELDQNRSQLDLEQAALVDYWMGR